MDGLVQKRCNSSAKALELHFFCTNDTPMQWSYISIMIQELVIQIFEERVALWWKIIIRSNHNFTHATTAQLWHVQNCDLIGSLLLKKQ